MWRLLRRKRGQANTAHLLGKLISLRAQDMRKLQQQAYVNAGHAIGVAPPVLAAFAEVESNGKGFNADGRLTICYEPHVASRNTAPKNGYVKAHPDLFSTNWRSEINRAAYRASQTDRWDMVARAGAIDFQAALKGTSWGAPQILGENAESLGFKSTFEMVKYMYEGPEAHLDCQIRYVRRHGLLDPLQKISLHIQTHGFDRSHSIILLIRQVTRAYNGTENVDEYSEKLTGAIDRKTRVFV